MEITKVSGIAELIALGSFGMIILIVFIFLFVIMYQKKANLHKLHLTESETKHQKELLAATIEVEEKERERIAKNLHDDIGMQLSVLKLHLSKIERNANNKELISELITESKSVLETGIQNIRSIYKDLMPPVLQTLGLEKTITEMCSTLNNTQTIKAEFVPGKHTLVLAADVQLQLYRIINEVLTNTLKHAAASHITISSNLTDTYTLCIQHNGCGINNSEITALSVQGKGIGLKSMLSRVQVINGSIRFETPTINKAEIIITCPLHKNLL